MQPNYEQWANRLIEWVEPKDIVEAYRQFEFLVNAGIAQDHAFNMVIADYV